MYTDLLLLLDRSSQCEELFPKNLNKTKKIYHDLVRFCHPDQSSGCDYHRFIRLNQLYQEAVTKLKNDCWGSKGMINLTFGGRSETIGYLAEKAFELGTTYLTHNNVFYLIDEGYTNYVRQFEKMCGSLQYASAAMAREFACHLPHDVKTRRTDDRRTLITMAKRADEIALDDLLSYCGGSLADEHAAWIISRLSSLGCLLSYNKLVHNSICLKNCFISPKDHQLSLYGGWWYACGLGRPMAGVCQEVYDIMPLKAKSGHIGVFATDLESIKQIGRQLINPHTPGKPPVRNWLDQGAGDSAFAEFELWNQAIIDSWGRRNFVKLSVTADDVYQVPKPHRSSAIGGKEVNNGKRKLEL